MSCNKIIITSAAYIILLQMSLSVQPTNSTLFPIFRSVSNQIQPPRDYSIKWLPRFKRSPVIRRIKKWRRNNQTLSSISTMPSKFRKVLKKRPAQILPESNRIHANISSSRDGRFFSIFTVIKFKNDPCITDSNLNGTCYKTSECVDRGGVSSGSCASGFGVCCYFEHSCGSSTSENGTYFKNPDSIQRICNMLIHRMNDDICQIRLEFELFDISEPNANGECSIDFFLATGGSVVPQICGINTGQHVVYSVTSNSGPTQLSMITDVTVGTTTTNRVWNIRVNQYECSSSVLAPNGCLQFYSGASGEVKSFNYKKTVVGDQPNHLANLNYAICIRMENGFCGIKYSQPLSDPFSFTLSGDASQVTESTTYPLAANGVKYGDSDCITDYIIISGGSKFGDRSIFSKDRFCGIALGYCSTTSIGASSCSATFGSVSSLMSPFLIGVVTDGNEGLPSITDKQNRGFHLIYNQQPCFSG